MGGRSCRYTTTVDRPITIAILGLDHAGKTTTAKVLEKTSVDWVTPTIGFAQYEIKHSNEKIKLYDLGGSKPFRDAWRHYYDDLYGFIYVIDASEQTRFDENYEVLKQLLQEEKIQNKPILILANKQDKIEALDKNIFLKNLKIEQLLNNHQNLYRVELCTSRLTNSEMDPAIKNGFNWLVKSIYVNYETLHKRVQHDIQKRNEIEQKAKRERQELVSKIREERAKQEDRENDEDEHHGFVPIEQAVKNDETKTTC